MIRDTKQIGWYIEGQDDSSEFIKKSTTEENFKQAGKLEPAKKFGENMRQFRITFSNTIAEKPSNLYVLWGSRFEIIVTTIVKLTWISLSVDIRLSG